MRARRARRFWLRLVLAAFVVGSSGPSAVGQARLNKDYCSSTGANLILAVDITTPYDAKDKELLVRAVGEIFETLHGGDRIVVRTIGAASTSSERLIDKCVPRCRANSTWDKMFNCNEGIILNDTKQVKHLLLQSLSARLAQFEEQPRSDIIRTIVSISREEGQRDHAQILYVFSDLIENSDYISGRSFFTTDTKKLLQYLKRYDLIAPLDGIDVRVFGFGRDGTPARAPLTVPARKKALDFWTAFFRESKAKSVGSIRTLPITNPHPPKEPCCPAPARSSPAAACAPMRSCALFSPRTGRP